MIGKRVIYRNKGIGDQRRYVDNEVIYTVTRTKIKNGKITIEELVSDKGTIYPGNWASKGNKEYEFLEVVEIE